MTRYSPFHPNSEATLKAAAVWFDRCLRVDGSLFGEEPLWTSEILSEADSCFNGRPDGSKDSFHVKLERQFHDAAPATCKLLAEMLWILNLFPTNMGPDAKRRPILTTWGWSGEILSGALADELMADDILRGLGSAGPGFMNHKPRELRFLINSMIALKAMEASERKRVLGDPWAFAEWIDGVPDEGYRQLRHILPHLMFPDEFERIASPGHVRKILLELGGVDRQTLRRMSKVEQDRKLLTVRHNLERERGGPIDFYQQDIKEKWLKEQEVEESAASEALAANAPSSASKVAAPLNQILYGPPGTGKTYRVVDRALAILDPEFAAKRESDRDALKERFDDLVSEGLIRFVTFHQSFSYEEFVEGLRAETTPDGAIRYHIQDGIFKALCQPSANQARIPVGERFSTGYVVTRSTPEILWLEKPNGSSLPLPWELLDELAGLVRQGRISIADIRDKLVFDRVPDSRLEKFLVNGYNNIIPLIVERLIASEARLEDHERKKVLIIDEINRGNISKILGELITLIEPSKRLGADEALTTMLPYSKTPFGVPVGVHIIGTMNTADRSLASIDMALRRRFVFEEIEPQPETLDEIELAGVNVGALLSVMNARIEALLDREHRLGHAYFLHLEAADDVSQLKQLFSRRILPLLKEYFFDDWQRIRLVLNDHRKADPADRFIVESADGSVSLFGAGEISVPTNKVWRLNTEALNRPSAYQQIIG
jgi:5-methylcytosine-specific restriction protein B